MRPESSPRGVLLAGGERLDARSGARLGAARLIELARQEEARARALGVGIVTLADDEYPALLREIPDPPPVLYIWGDLEPDDEVRVAVVGARRATRHGIGAAGTIAKGLGERGIVVVSGLARGVDAAAHAGALASGARTVAVLGSGLARIYPRENAQLAAQIAARGAVLSEYPLELGPLPQLFPRRNRVVSGLSAGTVVVEAGVVSGALVTARLALEQGRELFVVPGSILGEACEGSNGLLVEGVAHVAVSPREVLRELPPAFRIRLGLPASPLDEKPEEPRRPRPGGTFSFRGQKEPHDEREPTLDSFAARPHLPSPFNSTLDPEARSIYQRLSYDEPVTVDALVAECELPVPRLLAILSRLEMEGLAVTLPGNFVARSRP